MEAEPNNQEELSGKRFRQQLEATVRNIQWSYAIFWAVSTRQQGVLTWSDGYYNGDIKTRKTTQPMEFKVDQMEGLQRSEQLRELYGSLSAVDIHIRRPSASLSPEDLTDTEWYYLVCMSFTFLHGQGMPGRTFSNNQHIWLSNAPFADNKSFSRSLLAKSASIQTIICLPFMGGVLELGTTELVLEDPAFIEHVTSSFWELPIPVFSEQSISNSPIAERDDELVHPNLVHEIGDTTDMENHNLLTDCQNPVESCSPAFAFALPSYDSQKEDEQNQDNAEGLHADICEELQVGSPDDSLNVYGPNQNTEDSPRMEGLNGTSQVQSRQLIDDEYSNGFHGSLNSIDCIYQSFMHRPRVISPMGERIKDNVFDYLQEGNYNTLISLDLDGDDSHFKRTISAVVRNSNQLTSLPYSHNNYLESSFTVWTRSFNASTPLTSTPQKLLKKILVDAEWTYGDRPSKSHEDNGLKNKVCKFEGEDAGASHVLSERRRREKLNEKFLALRSLVPSISKVDKASILGDTIEYLKELEKRVEELESCREVVDLEARGRRKHLDISERTSDNYGSNEAENCRKTIASKRKLCDVEELDVEHHWVFTKDGAVDVNVTMSRKEVLVEMKSPWRDCLLLEIVEAINDLHMDPQSIQSSSTDNILVLVLRAKFRGSAVASPAMIKKTLQRVVSKCW